MDALTSIPVKPITTVKNKNFKYVIMLKTAMLIDFFFIIFIIGLKNLSSTKPVGIQIQFDVTNIIDEPVKAHFTIVIQSTSGNN